MKRLRLFALSGAVLVGMLPPVAQGAGLNLEGTVQAGSAFSIGTSGDGSGDLYIIGPSQVLRKNVQLGQSVKLPAGLLCAAGHYLVILTQGQDVETGSFEVTPLVAPARLSFLARPSRLPVSLHDGITGAVYVFDVYGNLIPAPTPVAFDLTAPSGSEQKGNVETRDGAAWTQLNSTSRQGIDRFVAQAGDASSTRVVGQVPGDPCGLKMTAQQSGEQLELKTAPVVDCSGNAVLDGTIVTFTEAYAGSQSTADVPLKHGIAEITLPAHQGAVLSVASGVVLGNQIRWEQ
jgi:hypothetical protein